VQILHGDCLAILPTLAADSVDAVVTDPPYGLKFMGREWDGSDGFRRSLNEADAGRDNAFGRMSKRGPEYRAGHLFQEWCEAWAKECLRVLKPGGHILAFGGTRTYHRLACAIEDAGFEVRDQIQWIYATGFPKSRATLKPAHEPIVMARKPLIGTVAANTKLHGTGALNIDACRVAAGVHAGKDREGEASAERRYTAKGVTNFAATPGPRGGDPQGRYPANIITDGSGEIIAAFPKSAGQQGDLKPTGRARPTKHAFGDMAPPLAHERRGDSGSAARFFYTAKADKVDRLGSKHPTIKPVDLIAYLCRLVTPSGGVVLDPFGGSGTTAAACAREGLDCILIEREAEYVADIKRRVAHISNTNSPLFAAAK
jgi:site-specific DNA-methyltransferase (adenine-specific)